ncbi:MAG TPA: hypothetical protein VMY38_05015 [Gemmatimonadaceae bacterium]|nr:hypothetical protein [Gemmatimonadaceae bacterium]
MAEKASAPTPPVVPAAGTPATPGTPGAPGVPPRRSPGHRGQDVRDTVAEMTAKAQEISLEAGSKMAAAMKDVVGAAAGLTGFVAESARDLVQYMVRRGQMTQEEADKLIREVEEHHGKRKPAATSRSSAPAKPSSAKPAAKHVAPKAKPAAKKAAPARKPAAKKPAAKTATKKPAAKKASRR